MVFLMIKKISKIMWGTILGLFLFSIVLSIAGGNGTLIASYVGQLAVFALLIQLILSSIGRKKTDTGSDD